MATKISAEEKRWQAESDAETMARYEEIMGNASRRSAAIKVAKQKAADLTKRAGVMSRVAGSTSTPKTRKK